MNSYVGTVSLDSGICDGRHTWGELSGESILILTRTKKLSPANLRTTVGLIQSMKPCG